MENEEFDAKFPNLGATDPKEGWYDAKPEVKAFITTSIHQAEQEIIKRVEDWFTNAPKYRTKKRLIDSLINRLTSFPP